jgi:hypothetical protein
MEREQSVRELGWLFRNATPVRSGRRVADRDGQVARATHFFRGVLAGCLWNCERLLSESGWPNIGMAMVLW